MRLGDLDALSAFVGDLRSTLHKEQSTFKAMKQSEFEIKDNMLLNFQYAIDNAPTVERPQGEWIDHSEDYGYVECPFCERLTSCEGNIDELRYCWNCGAEMRKGDNNDT